MTRGITRLSLLASQPPRWYNSLMPKGLKGFQPGNTYRYQPGNKLGCLAKGKPKRIKVSTQLSTIATVQPESDAQAQLLLKAIDSIMRHGTDEQRMQAAMLLLERIAGRPRSRRLGK